MSVGWLGLHAGAVTSLDRRQLSRDLQYTSGRECLPLPICIGQLLEIHERRGAGEIAGSICWRAERLVSSMRYMGYLERFYRRTALGRSFLADPRS